MQELVLEEVTRDNWQAALALGVFPEQQHFVADTAPIAAIALARWIDRTHRPGTRWPCIVLRQNATRPPAQLPPYAAASLASRASEEAAMRKVRWMLCSLVMTFAACAVDIPTEDSTATDEAVQAVTTCTFTQGPCMRGRCEGQTSGPPDFFAHGTEVCCTDGVCTTRRFRVCGC